jgi:hypothetical protein
MYAVLLLCSKAKLLNLELKTRPKQLLVYLTLAFALPGERERVRKGESEKGRE